jgi:hypothetical protein
MSRHLIFILPFFMFAVGGGIVRVASLGRGWSLLIGVAAVLALLPAEVSWGMYRTPELYRGQAQSIVDARVAAADWLARYAQPDDVLFGYEPLDEQAWENGGKVSKLVIPRADSKLALQTLVSAGKPLGHGVWVFDASDTTNGVRSATIPFISPQPASAFRVAQFGPYLVVRTVKPTECVRNYLKLARRVEWVGESLALGDADVNMLTIEQAAQRLTRMANPPPC